LIDVEISDLLEDRCAKFYTFLICEFIGLLCLDENLVELF